MENKEEKKSSYKVMCIRTIMVLNIFVFGNAGLVNSNGRAVFAAEISALIDPREYGVVGDGITDDADSLQACVTAAAGRAIWIDGLTIRVPAGNEIILPSTGLDLRGRGTIVYEGTGTLFLGAEIDVTTYSPTATANQKVFTIMDPYKCGYIEVFVNNVLRDHRDYTVAHNTTTLTVTFVSGAASVNGDVRIEVSRIDPVGILDGFARVSIGTGVVIQTTQVNQGRAFALGWNDNNWQKRQYPRFQMEDGSVIMGKDGTKGFKNAIWLNAFQNVEIAGYIYGVGANLIPAGGQATDETCDIAVLLTGQFTPSDVKLYGGMIGYYKRGVATYWDTVEGIACTGFTFLNVGHAIWWEAKTTDVGLLLAMNACHANCYRGVAYTRLISEVFIGDSDFYQNPRSNLGQFNFFELSGSSGNAIHDNKFRSYVTGANCTGVLAGDGTRGLRVHDNIFEASDATSVFTGTVCASGSFDCVVGPNTYKNIDCALVAEAGSDRIGAITRGDVFMTPPQNRARYQLTASSNWWSDEKWLVLASTAVQSVANATLTTPTLEENRDPESVYSGETLTAPAWATSVQTLGSFSFTANTAGVRMVRVLKNDVETAAKAQVNASITGLTSVNFDEEFNVTGGDVITVQVYQNSGGTLNLNVGATLYVLFR